MHKSFSPVLCKSLACPAGRCAGSRLAAALVVGDALGLGRAGLFGGEGQDDQGDEIGQHPVHMGADPDLDQREVPVGVDVQAGVGRRDALEQAEQQRTQRDIERLPVAEDHDREGQEAKPRHVAVGRAVCGGQGVDEAAHTGQGAGDGGAGIAHPVDVDAEGIRGLGVLAAGAQPEAEAGFVEDDREDHEQQDADIGGDIGLVHKGVAEEAEIRLAAVAQGGLFDHEPAGGVNGEQGVLVCDDADQKQHEGGRHQVQGGAADGLVRAEVDGGEAQEQGEDRAHHRGQQHGQQFQSLERDPVPGGLGGGEERCLRHDAHEHHADECAEDHDALQREIDDAAALGEDAGQRHDHQRHRVKQGLLDQERHFPAPPFVCSGSVGCSGSFGFFGSVGGSVSPAGASPACGASRFFRRVSSIRITREKALR